MRLALHILPLLLLFSPLARASDPSGSARGSSSSEYYTASSSPRIQPAVPLANTGAGSSSSLPALHKGNLDSESFTLMLAQLRDRMGAIEAESRAGREFGSARSDVGAMGRSRMQLQDSDVRRGGRGRHASRALTADAASGAGDNTPPLSAVDGGRGVGGERSTTRNALESAVEQLQELQLEKELQEKRLAHLPSARRAYSMPTTAHGALTPTSASYDLAPAQRGSTGTSNTPRAAAASRVFSYSPWDTRRALRRLNIPAQSLADIPDQGALDHWLNTVNALRSHEWSHQLRNRLHWAGKHRISDTRTTQVVTPFGVAGSTTRMGSPRFVSSPNDPEPRLDNLLPTDTQMRIKAWLTIADSFPPALTAHSASIWNDHHAGSYHEIEKSIHDAVHPVQYISQMMLDNNGATTIENVLHRSFHDSLQNDGVRLKAMAKIKAKLQKELKAKKDKQQPIEDVLGTHHAVYDGFWHEHYHDKQAFPIEDVLKTPLEYWNAFAPWSQAVALEHPL